MRLLPDMPISPRTVPFQISFSTLLAASLAVAIFQPAALQAALLLAGLFLLSVGSFCMRTFRQDRAVALASPSLLFLRSLAQFLGLLAGAVVFLWQREVQKGVLGVLLERRMV